jgi:hypothetical protein
MLDKVYGNLELLSESHWNYESLYHQGNNCESILSVIKSKFGSKIKSYNDSLKENDCCIICWLTIVTDMYDFLFIVYDVSRNMLII